MKRTTLNGLERGTCITVYCPERRKNQRYVEGHFYRADADPNIIHYTSDLGFRIARLEDVEINHSKEQERKNALKMEENSSK